MRDNIESRKKKIENKSLRSGYRKKNHKIVL